MSPRFVLIIRGSGQPGEGPKYEIRDANRYGEEGAGFAELPYLRTREDARDWLISEGVLQSEIDGLLQTVDEQGHMSVRVTPRIGPRIVRAWFDTVVNPLIRALESELTLIEKRNWTWSFRPASLELIRPAQLYLEHNAAANLDQVCHLNPTIAANLQSHDGAAEALANSVAALHRALTSSKAFADLCDSLWTPDALSAIGIQDVQDIFGAYGPEDRYNLIAQHIVNNSGKLPAYYSTAKFWNRNRDVLIGALNLPGILPDYDSVLRSGRHLAEASQVFSRQLKDFRLKLSLDHDVPYVPGSLASAVQ